ncbi:MAG TPA: ABC transporter permease [Vicinamibacterales bacterium]|nr:ABC transporter permease [Vicinamibacterales bacterium]
MSWRRPFRARDILERQLDAELRYHFDRLVADHIAAGVPDDEARRRARLEFGGLEQAKEVCRDTRGFQWLDRTARHVRDAARTFRGAPGSAALIVGTLGLAIGANTAIFSVAKAVIFTPLPFHAPDRVVHLFDGHQGDRYQPGRENILMSVRPGRFLDWRDACRAYDGMAIVRRSSVILDAGDRAIAVDAFLAGDGYFEVLGVPAQIGRALVASDYAPEGERAVVLSDRLWRERYNADPSSVGRDIVVDGAAHQIVGVMPPGFHPTRSTRGDDPQLWLPLNLDASTKYSRTMWGHLVYARLKAGVTLEEAQAELDAVEAGVRAAHPGETGYAVVAPVAGYTYGQHEQLFWLLLLAVALVLLITCANVANLLLARAFEREREFAMRTALGASRGAIIGQVLIESLIMAGVAGVVGVVLSRVLIPPIVSMLPASSQLPRLDQVHVDGGVLAFTFVIALLAGLLFGAVPAMRAATGHVFAGLNGSGRGGSMGRRERRLSDALIVVEVALSLVLLTAGGLLVQAFLKLLHDDPGFRPAQSVALRLAIPTSQYAMNDANGGTSARQQLYDRVEAAVQATPGVEAAGLTGLLPLRQFWDPEGLTIEGRPAPAPDKFGGAGIDRQTGLPYHGTIAIQRVTPGYFAALAIRLERGRLFDDHDRPNAPMVAVINETAARAFFNAEDPIGKRVRVGLPMTIVGVVADSRLTGMDREVSPEVFWPMAYSPSASVWVVARTKRGAETATADIRRALGPAAPDVAVAEMTTMSGVLNDSLWQPRIAAVLVGVFAGLAVLIAMSGLYAVISYAVARQTREFGVRVALGASGGRITAAVLGHGLRVTALGIVSGSVIAIVLSRAVSRAVPALAASSWDVTHLSVKAPPSLGQSPWILAGVAGVLVVLTIAACWAPVRRALTVDPMVALRMD